MLSFLADYAARLPEETNKVPLARLMTLAALVRGHAGGSSQGPSRDTLTQALAASTANEIDWGRKWAHWMVASSSLADGAPWSSLVSLDMPEPARAAFWVILATRLSAEETQAVPPATRATLLRTLGEETLNQADRRRGQELPEAWPPALLTAAFSAKDPLNALLIGWRATSCPELVSLAVERHADALLQRLVGFGADLNQRVSKEYTLLQDIALHRRYWSASNKMGNVRTDWQVKTAQNESLVHLLFKRATFPGEGYVGGGWPSALGLLTRFAAHMPATVWAEPDDSGQTPWAALQAFRAQVSQMSPNEATYESWIVKNAGLAHAMEAGDLQHALDTAMPQVAAARPRPRM